MDAYSLMRMLGALAVVLGLLAGALWIVRRYDIGLPGRIGNVGGSRRIEVIERTTLDGRRSVALLRRDGREHLILLSPEGNVMLEAGIIRDDIDQAAEVARIEAQRQAAETSRAEAEAFRESFAAMVEKTRTSVKDSLKSAEPILQQVRSRLLAPSAAPPSPSPAAPPPAAPVAPAGTPAKAATPAPLQRKGRRSPAKRSRTAGASRA
jgi:flagellar biogenesis protein FliO